MAKDRTFSVRFFCSGTELGREVANFKFILHFSQSGARKSRAVFSWPPFAMVALISLVPWRVISLDGSGLGAAGEGVQDPSVALEGLNGFKDVRR